MPWSTAIAKAIAADNRDASNGVCQAAYVGGYCAIKLPFPIKKNAKDSPAPTEAESTLDFKANRSCAVSAAETAAMANWKRHTIWKISKSSGFWLRTSLLGYAVAAFLFIIGCSN